MVSELGRLYMSNITIQGDGQTGRRDATEAIFLPDVSASIFAEGPNPRANMSNTLQPSL